MEARVAAEQREGGISDLRLLHGCTGVLHPFQEHGPSTNTSFHLVHCCTHTVHCGAGMCCFSYKGGSRVRLPRFLLCWSMLHVPGLVSFDIQKRWAMIQQSTGDSVRPILKHTAEPEVTLR